MAEHVVSREIVKVQLSALTTEATAQVMIYNEDRSRQGSFSLTAEVNECVGGALKSFWWARWHPATTTYELLEPADWRDW